jgi:hypothetical protein
VCAQRWQERLPALGGGRLEGARSPPTCDDPRLDERTFAMTLRPKKPKDLMLAPLAAEIDLNLQDLRDLTPDEIAGEVALRLNVLTSGSDRPKRAAWILACALWEVEMHDWQAEITDDSARLRLSGGSVTLDLGLSATIHRYIEDGR